MFAYCNNAPVSLSDSGGSIPKEEADELITKYSSNIIAAGVKYGVDPVVIACCIYSEQVLNVNWLDSVFDNLLFFFDTSIGIGQVRISTAILLEDSGYIEESEPIHVGTIHFSREQLIQNKLDNPEWNIKYVAAYLRYWQDCWQTTLDISNKPEILATLYNLGENANAPNANPKPNDFGRHAQSVYHHIASLLYNVRVSHVCYTAE